MVTTADLARTDDELMHITADINNPSFKQTGGVRKRVFLALTPWEELNYDNIRDRTEQNNFMIEKAQGLFN